MKNWTEQYIFLVLRISKAVQSQTQDILHDFYGNPQFEEHIANEEVRSGEELIRETMELLDALPLQGFEPNRVSYISKHLIALETVCRRLAGERLSLKEEANRYFGLNIEYYPYMTRDSQVQAPFKNA